MLAWNSPYVLAVIIGLIAVGIYHFDQKQKKNEIQKISYVKIFVLVAGSITGFYQFIYPSLASNPTSTQSSSSGTSGSGSGTGTVSGSGSGSIVAPIPQIAQSGSGTTAPTQSLNLSMNGGQALRTSPVSAFTPYKSDSISILGSGLKIREGPVPF
jgi:hypothetical protein